MLSREYRCLNIDPAMSICGWSILDFKIDKIKNNTFPKIAINRFGCIKSAAEANKVFYNDQVDIFSKQIITLSLLRDSIGLLIKEFNPDFIIIEDAFYNPKCPSAYGSLLQCICTIAMFCRDKYNKPVYRIPTRSAKQSLFGIGSANKKDIIGAVLACPNLMFKQKKSAELMGEHEADSIAIGYHFIMNVLPGLSPTNQLTT